jgi:hypothetical protein
LCMLRRHCDEKLHSLFSSYCPSIAWDTCIKIVRKLKKHLAP